MLLIMLVLHELPCAVVLVPNELQSAVKWASSEDSQFAETGVCSGVVLSNIGVVSTYVVCRGENQDLFMEAIDQTR